MSLLQQTPRLDVDAAVRIVRELYGLEADAAPLPSERDQNFSLMTAAGGRFVLKIANGGEARATLEAQNGAMTHLGTTGLCPRVLPGLDGGVIGSYESSSEVHLVRVLAWLPGEPLAMLRWHSPELLEEIGRRLGELDRGLATFDHPAIHRAFHWDLV